MAAPLTNQATCTGNSNSVALSSVPITCTAFVIKAPLSNSAAVFIGPSGVTSALGHQLDPGDEYTYERNTQTGANRYELSVESFYVAGTSGDKVTWLASP